MQNPTKNKSKVYLKRMQDFSGDINEHLVSIFQKIEGVDFIKKDSFVAIKLSFGEEGNKGFIKPKWLKDLVGLLKQKTENVFIVETNTLYREKRANTVGHLHIANQHGFNIESLGVPIIIADGLHGRNSKTISIRGIHFDSVKIARDISEADILITLSHVTGHIQAGFAGSLKNLGMGCASRAGKLLQHAGTPPEVDLDKCTGCSLCVDICPVNAIGLKKKRALLVKERCINCGECTVICRSGAIKIKYDEKTVKFQEKMVEYSLGVNKALDSKIVNINFLYNITKNCDCMAKEEAPISPDIGIIGGLDPVALDKASIDLVGVERFKEIFQEIDPLVQIRHAEKIKLGSSDYELLEV